jgi:Mce-associated membrane protein
MSDEDDGTAKRKPTRAERLEAKAARLREAEERREQGAAGPSPIPVGAIVAAGVLVTALAAALVVFIVAWHSQRDTSHGWRAAWHRLHESADSRSEAVNAAKAFAVDFGSYDYRHLDVEFQEVAKRMTPSFANNYLDSTTKLKPTFVQYKTQVTARIQGYGVTLSAAAKATVVVFLDQTVRTSQSSTPRVDRNRLEIHLVQQDGKWLVAKLLAK